MLCFVPDLLLEVSSYERLTFWVFTQKFHRQNTRWNTSIASSDSPMSKQVFYGLVLDPQNGPF